MSTIENEILGHDKEVRDMFLEHFADDVMKFIKSVDKIQERLAEIDSEIGGHTQKALVVAYLYNVIRNLMISMKLTIHGYLVPSGNLMRHAFESVSMAILCSRSDLSYLKKIENKKFDVNKAAKIVVDNADKLNVGKEAMKSFKKKLAFYHNYSHASLFSIASQHSFGVKGGFYLGANFDEKKLPEYQKEIRTKISFSKSLFNIIEGVMQNARWREEKI
jgi:hypothetical protein